MHEEILSFLRRFTEFEYCRNLVSKIGTPGRGCVKFFANQCDGFHFRHRRLRLPSRAGVLIRQPRLHHQRLRQDFSPRLGFKPVGKRSDLRPIISTELASNLSDKVQSTSTRPDQDDGAYPPILMKLPDDLAAVFTTRASSPHRPRRDPASAPARPSSMEVGVILQPLGTVSTEQLDGYLSSPGVDLQPTEIVEYDDFGYRYDYRNLDDFNEGFEDNYTPLYFGIFMADNETEEQRKAREAEELRVQQEAERRRLEEKRQAQERERLQPITLLDTLLKEDTLNQANHVVNILNQTKTMIAASVPINSASVRTPTGSRVPHLRSQDYHQPSLSVAGAGSSRRSKGHDERSVHSPPERHRERRVERPRSPPCRRPVDLRDTINQRHATRGYAPHHSPDRYDDDVDGVAAFTSDLRRVDWPAGFKPTGIEKYEGTTNPESWLTAYGLAIRAAGGDSKAMANYLPVALADSAQSWLHGLPRGTIGSWAELRDHFIANFQGTFERPGTQFDLYNIIQKSGESLRDYIRRFSEQRNKISDITDNVIIAAFTKGIRHEDLVGKFGRKPPKTVKQMFEKANEYAKAEDAITTSKQSGTTWKPKKDTPTIGGSGSTNHKDRKRKPKELVANTTPSSRQRSRINTFDKIMNSQCPHHPNSNHAAKDCFVYKQFVEQYAKNARKTSDGDQSTSKKKDDEDDTPTGFQDHCKELNHIFGEPLAYESKRKQKLTEREINAVQPDTPQYLRCTRLRRSLIDGGSALNILFAKTLDDMQIPRTELKPSNSPFHGVIPGLSATPLGQITLPVTFGTGENFRTENVCFEVADFETVYHAILGRPALAKFMAVPHYTYMMMKMPGPRGVISLWSDIKQAVTCDKESCEMAQIRESTLAREEIRLAASTASEGEMGQWRMCVDYTDLNKSCPKDPFGLPCIDQVVDSTAGCELLSFLDCYSRYHQTRLKESDCLKTSFITPFGAYYYITMPFGLKNAGETYQRMIQRCFSTQIGRNVEAYVDDVVVKTKQKDDLITDLEETFASIRAFKMKLNPEKCIFGVPSGKLLGFMVSHRGIQANPEKISAILNMKPPSSQKDVQKLTGCMAALSRFVSRLGERGMPFFKLLMKTDNFQWGPEAQKAFEDFKKLLTTPLLLASPHPQEPLLLYVSAASHVVSTVLAMEYWTMHFDGSKRLSGTGAGVVLISPTGERLSYVLWIHFSVSHNVAEYEALLHGLRIAISLGIQHLIVRGDSQLVVNQVMKEWSCLDDNMTTYRQEVCKLEDKFDGLELTHVLRHNNEAADKLANFAPFDVFVEHLYEPTVPRKETIEATDTQDKRNPSGILQRCVSLEEGRQLLKDIHSGICGNHAATRTIVSKAYRQGFFWPTAVSDVDKIVRICEGCQFFARQTYLPAQEQQTIPLSWPFAVWGLDMVGLFKKAIGGYTHLFVAVDKFSKWIEAKPVITITADKARDFFINIVHRFGWVEQLSSVLWSLHTTPSRATGQSPFFLVYGAEAMLPSEVEFESLRFHNFSEERYGEDRVDDLNRLEEAREAALIQSAQYLQGMCRYHNCNV
uniref:Polyprotein n=1 Tax=Oryza sativa subsp. japonica TaxID=39947 RepID=Q5W763_ORYSJ|nr:putative polyprotein [Oryza sativa Japonica Group]